MGILNYSLNQRTNPIKKTKMYYATAQTTGSMKFDKLKSRIATISTASVGDVGLVLDGLITLITQEITEGRTIILDNLGTFSLQFSSTGVVNAADFKPESIKRVHLLFRPAKKLTENCKQDLQFIRTTTVAAKQALLKAQKVKDGSAGKGSQTGGNTGENTGGNTGGGTTPTEP